MIGTTDPVCGMTIKEKGPTLTSSYGGLVYYFCSYQCKAAFDRDPEGVLVMKEARERAAEKERTESLEKMIDAAAHEIRNPLTSIGGFTRRIYEGLPEDDPNKEYAKMIIGEVARLEDMIRQLVELKTMGTPYAEPSNVNDIINDAIEIFDKELKEKNIKVELELPNHLPDIDLDKIKMKAAIANLVRNAIEAMGKAPKFIKIATRVSDEYVEITVSDTGRGIPVDKIKYIFDPLFTSKIYGPGVGLTVVRRIILEHKGTISVESEPGKGAAFTIRLPLKVSEIAGDSE